MTTVLDQAMYLSSQSICVIPVPAKSKAPTINWVKWQKELPSTAQVRKWFTKGDSNLAVVCGEVSGNLVVIDIDPQNGGSLELLEDALGIEFAEDVVTVRTGGGGLHLYFRSDKPVGSCKLMQGVEFRSNGSIVIAPPSVHPKSEKEYKLINGDYSSITALPEAFAVFSLMRNSNVADIDEPTDELRNELDEHLYSCLPGDLLDLYKFSKDTYMKDRSGKAFLFAVGLLENNCIDADDIPRLAAAIYASSIYQQKFSARSDSWQNAVIMAHRAVDKFRTSYKAPTTKVQLPAKSVVLSYTGIYNTNENFLHVKDFRYPIMPLEWFPEGFARDYVHYAHTQLGQIPAYVYFSLMTCMCGLMGNKFSIDIASRNYFPQAYTLLLGDSGSTHKSTTIQTTVGLFRQAVDKDDNKVLSNMSFGSGEGLLSYMSEVSQESPDNNTRFVLILDEFESLLVRSAREGNTLAVYLQSLFGGRDAGNATAKRVIKVENANLNLLAASTPEAFISRWSASHTDGGLLNRFFLVGPMYTKFNWQLAGDEGVESAFASKLTRIIANAYAVADNSTSRVCLAGVPLPSNSSFTYTMDAEALAKWKHYSEYIYELMKEFPQAVRITTYGMTLMLMDMLFRNDFGPITLDVVSRVIHLLDYQMAMRTLASANGFASKAAELEGKIVRVLEANGGELAIADIRRYTNAARMGSIVFNQIIDSMLKAGILVRINKTSAAGRQQVFCRLVGD